MDEETKIFFFRQGLKPFIARQLLVIKPKSLAEAMNEAIRVELQHQQVGPSTFNHYNRFHHTNQNNNQALTNHTGADSTPMELGLVDHMYGADMFGESSINAMNGYSGNYGGNNTSVNHGRRTKLTPAERDRCVKEGLCFYCRKRGHNAIECRSRPKSMLSAATSATTTNSTTNASLPKNAQSQQ